jgi:catechol 2,3-dioxygenase-like lactoylglutathione lyase family enzyme
MARRFHMPDLPGIHHVTAICSDAQTNVDFYTGVLGLRLVKVTVNFDDPSSYHLYYGDASGSPGTIMTFFAWPGAHRGRIGAPQVTTTAFAIPSSAVQFWSARLKQQGIDEVRAGERFGEQALSFADPDGLQLELIATKDAPADRMWKTAELPAEHAIRGFHSVTLSEEGYEFTAKLLTETMGFAAGRSEQGRFRYSAGDAKPGAIVDLLCVPDSRHGTMGAGVVHHVAFRTPDESQQLEWRKRLVSGGFNVSPVMDRNYFHSIYFREPGGVLFEIATNAPGFAVDEPQEKLGESLKLPAQYEPLRRELENFLPKLKTRS